MNINVVAKEQYRVTDNGKEQLSRVFRYPNLMIDEHYLKINPKHIFVFGDNLLRFGKGGAASLRDMPNTYGFITKKEPNNKISSFYQIDEYRPVFKDEYEKLDNKISSLPNYVFLISKLGAGLANKFCIFENVIEKPIIALAAKYKNTYLLW